MNKITLKSSWKNCFAAAGITWLLYSSGILAFFTPLPACYIGYRYGKSEGVRSIVLSLSLALIAYFFVFPLIHSGGAKSLEYFLPMSGIADYAGLYAAALLGVLFFSGFMIVSGVVVKSVCNQLNALKVVLYPSIIATSAILIGVLFFTAVGIDFIGGLRNVITEMLNEFISASESAGGGSQQAFLIKSQRETIVSISLQIMPAMFFLYVFFVSAINLISLKWYFSRINSSAEIPDMKRIDLPFRLVWFTIAVGFTYFVNLYVVKNNFIEIFAINILIILVSIYFLQGFVVSSIFLNKVRGRFIKAVLYASIFLFFQIFGPMLALVGFADLWVDFRKILTKRTK